MKPVDIARAAVPDGEILAAAICQVRPGSSGLPVRQFVLLAGGRERLHVVDMGRRMLRWKARGTLGSWDRSEVRVAADVTFLSSRLSLTVPAAGVWLDLDSPAGGAADTAAVARLLVDAVPVGTVPANPRGGLAPPPHLGGVREETEESRRLFRRAGTLALVGGFARLAAYLMPWVVLSRPGGLYAPVGISGLRGLGTPVFSLGFSVATIVVGVLYLKDRRAVASNMLVWGGGSAMVVFLWHSHRRRAPSARPETGWRLAGSRWRSASGSGSSWRGAAMILVAGVTALAAARATEPVRPDRPVATRT
jgi:hypothetical protein